MTINTRFEIFLREAKTNQKEFAKKTGYSQQSLSKFITGGTKSPKLDLLVAVAEYYPTFNLRWLLLGEGELWLDGNNNLNTEQASTLFQEHQLLTQENDNLKKLLKAKEEIIELLKNGK